MCIRDSAVTVAQAWRRRGWHLVSHACPRPVRVDVLRLECKDADACGHDLRCAFQPGWCAGTAGGGNDGVLHGHRADRTCDHAQILEPGGCTRRVRESE